jgi:hypothetical protein
METNTPANSIEALRRKMLIAGTAGLHKHEKESEPVDASTQQAESEAKAASAQEQSGQDEEKTAQS